MIGGINAGGRRSDGVLRIPLRLRSGALRSRALYSSGTVLVLTRDG